MFDIQFMLTAGFTMMGLVCAVPPREIFNSLKHLRSKSSVIRQPIPGDASKDPPENDGRRP